MPDSPAQPLLTRRGFLLMAGIGVAGAAMAYRIDRHGPRSPLVTLSVQQAHSRAASGDITLIDIRTPREWRATGIGAGARPIDMRRRDFVEALVAAQWQNPQAPVALICARGVRSARLGRRLTEAGLPGIIDVPEGMLGSTAGPGWLAAGLPVVPFQGQA